ncbi:MAG: methionyl aminopeptidase [Clostridiales bacterium]|nr:methionyl aminopeptidase [Clostridiales bacterium]MDY3747118.1 methionyl aminopeptidase [Lachnospiraceae bacterium]
MKKIGRNDPCWCGSGKKYKVCHEAFDNKILRFKDAGHIVPTHEIIKTKAQIAGIRESGKVNVAILNEVAARIKPGMTTQEIDDIVAAETKKYGAIAAPLNYEGFPKSVCTSINSQVCHGIPSEEDVLEEGDIVNVDVSTIYKGYYSDSSRMFCIGNVCDEWRRLVDVTKESIQIGLNEVKPWGFLGDMGEAIHTFIKAHGYTVVQDIGGHGVGLEFHEDPFVSYVTKRGTEMLMVPGMVFTIEPMVNMGTDEIFVDEDNDWTVYTDDNMPSAQWEVTVAVTEDGYEVLAW